MSWRTVALLLALATPAWAAEPLAELELISEHPVAGMKAGNLSGLAWCGDGLWAVSDREDSLLYRLDADEDSASDVWRAHTERFELPPVPDTGLPWGVRIRTQVSGLVLGGQMDFEGLACDQLGNRYLVSEAHAAVLRVSPAGTSQWLNFPSGLIRQARASGMLLKFNAMFEGIAVDPDAGRMWLAAERERRGLLVMHRNQSNWQCIGGCVLLVEGGNELPPPALGERPLPKSFSAVAYFKDRLFTLEPNAHQVCRRNPVSGAVERCWSYAGTALTESRRYDTPFGNAEALSLDEQGAWIGIDNNGQARADGEERPVVWRFAAPRGGWRGR